MQPPLTTNLQSVIEPNKIHAGCMMHIIVLICKKSVETISM